MLPATINLPWSWHWELPRSRGRLRTCRASLRDPTNVLFIMARSVEEVETLAKSRSLMRCGWLSPGRRSPTYADMRTDRSAYPKPRTTRGRRSMRPRRDRAAPSQDARGREHTSEADRGRSDARQVWRLYRLDGLQPRVKTKRRASTCSAVTSPRRRHRINPGAGLRSRPDARWRQISPPRGDRSMESRERLRDAHRRLRSLAGGPFRYCARHRRRGTRR